MLSAKKEEMSPPQDDSASSEGPQHISRRAVSFDLRRSFDLELM
eukprot:CAMPEP_0194483110 /NCGR_PEP_ID=MMETSP0253-20130528/4821_1 /TAXON_ID=2966 /ORGANISM="Noctiluca scintillans" /LENGTH=43 /DNA_ID= /DNA_START= /DNA_END= /DNA_ORIENTATION=